MPMENRIPKNRYNGGAAPDADKSADKQDTLKKIEAEMDTDIGGVSVTGNVKPGVSVQLTATKTDFTKSDGKASFPFSLYTDGKDFTSASWSEDELRADPAKEIPLIVHIPTETWNKAEAGDYKATITFTAQLKES